MTWNSWVLRRGCVYFFVDSGLIRHCNSDVESGMKTKSAKVTISESDAHTASKNAAEFMLKRLKKAKEIRKEMESRYSLGYQKQALRRLH